MWNGYKTVEFEFRGRNAILVFPNEENRTTNWLLKTEYFDAFQGLELEMVKRGWHLAFISNKTRWCLDEDLDIKKEFADYLIQEYALSEKCVPIGMSCGGMIGVKFAAKYPQYVSKLYLDAPVMNLLSCPCGVGREKNEEVIALYHEFVSATGKTVTDLINYREHPIDKIPQLLEYRIPVVLVYGTKDEIVPYHENGYILEQQYRAKGEKLLVIKKEGCGHHPHGVENPENIIDFLIGETYIVS